MVLGRCLCSILRRRVPAFLCRREVKGMKTIEGIAASEGYAIGKLYLNVTREIMTTPEKARDPHWEINRFLKARENACTEISSVYHRAVARVGEHHSDIFKIHLALLQDEDFFLAVHDCIMEKGVTAETAVQEAGEQFFRMFEEIDDDYMKARGADIRDITDRVLYYLRDERGEIQAPWIPLDAEGILAVDEVMPSQMIQVDTDRICGMISRSGSRTSHSAILARSMRMPAITGIDQEFSQLKHGSQVILDGFTGKLIQDPDEETLWRYRRLAKQYEERQKELESYKGMKAVTLDGTVIHLTANISHPNDMSEVLDVGADGVGLFRSEFLFMFWGRLPTEEEQFQSYRRVLEQMQGKRVVIRTLDIGADKQVPYLKMEREENPAMGRRSIRFCLANRSLFLTQLRALLRAAAYGKLAILIPMVVSVEEVLAVRHLLEEAAAQLEKEHVPFSQEYEFGIMIETPSAVMISDLLAPYADFFSIGTNDLIQFTLAADRENPHVGSLCDARHPAVRRLIEIAVKNGIKQGLWVSVCGEAAADPDMTRFFLSAGVRELSVVPASLLEIRHMIQSIRLP